MFRTHKKHPRFTQESGVFLFDGFLTKTASWRERARFYRIFLGLTFILVFQFPVYWFNAPAMLKHWYEEVFTPGFAHGEGASGLKGKKLIISATAGAPDGAYSTAGMGHTLDEFFDNFYVMAAMTGMEMAKPILTYGAMFIPGVSTEADKEKLVSLAKEHAKKLLEEIGD